MAGIDILPGICLGLFFCVRLPTSSDHPCASRLARVRAISWRSWMAAASSSRDYYYSDMAVIGYNIATHLDICVLSVCRTFGPPDFRLDMQCHNFGNCRPFGSPYVRLDMKCHHFGNCRHFGSPYFRLDYSAIILAIAVLSARRTFGSIILPSFWQLPSFRFAVLPARF